MLRSTFIWNSFLRMCLFALLSIFFCVLTTAANIEAEDSAIADEVCLDCHDEGETGLWGSPHQLGASARGDKTTTISCVACHTGAKEHISEPSAANILNPNSGEKSEVTKLCTTCHVGHLVRGGLAHDPHTIQGVRCTSCHTVHGGEEPPEEMSKVCARCHSAVLMQFNRLSNHPIGDGVITCANCHFFTEDNEPQFGHGAAANCYRCHPEQGGPFRYEHGAANSFSPNGGGCTSCHVPHGGPNDRLLTQPGTSLCTQCHGIPVLHRTAHFTGLGTQYQCVECHSEVHGSDFGSKLLDPELDQKIPGGNCYNAGCHILN